MIQNELFPTFEVKNNAYSVGNGYSIEFASDKLLTVYRYGVPYKKTEIKAAIDRRRLAVELVSECQVTKCKLAKALKVSRQSIDNWVDTYKKAGFEGLVNSYKGSIKHGRQEKNINLPRGNKARQLEEERRHKREELQKQQLSINFVADEGGEKEEVVDTFNEQHDFQKNRYAGSFLYWGIFQHFFNFMDLCEPFLAKHSIVIYVFIMMLINRISSIEGLKLVFKREFGQLIGLKQLPSKTTLWKYIHDACNLKKSQLLLNNFFNYQARTGLVALYWLYIDGHFIPYYGKEHTESGYYTQRGQMMPGQTAMYVHDCKGKIVYFETQEGKGDLKEMMRRMSEQWALYIGDISPLIIVDREGWGVKHFLSMSGHRFVTWEKFSKAEELQSIQTDEFGALFCVNSIPYQAVDGLKVYSDQDGNSIELRRIVIWNKSTNKRVACVAPVEVNENAETIASAMLGRWGANENSFKYMKKRFNMHYNPLMDFSKESKDQEISNPKYTKLNKELAILKKKLSSIERNLGKLPLTTKKDGSLRKSKRRDRLQEDRVNVKTQIDANIKQQEKCPKRIKIGEIDQDAKFKVLDTEGKNLWDLAQALAWNSRKLLTDMFSNYLPNPRDLLPVLDAITYCHGWVRSTREVIEIRLEPLDTPGFRAAQIQLCRALNEKEIRLRNGKRLLYDVGPTPKNVQKNRS